MMAATERMRNDRCTLAAVERWAAHLEQREILIAAMQQDLVAEARCHRESKHRGVKSLSAREVGYLDAKMIQPLQFHLVLWSKLSTRNRR